MHRTATAGLPELRSAFEVVTKLWHLAEAAAQAVHQLSVKRALGLRQCIEDPQSLLLSFDEPSRTQMSKMPRGGGLRDTQELHEVADAEVSLVKEVQDTQPSRIREGLEQARWGGGLRTNHVSSISGCPNVIKPKGDLPDV